MSITQQFEAALNNAPFLAYLFAFVGGLLDCLTPCSAFATPVALGYFSSLNPTIPKRRVGLLTAVFALSVSVSYALMGLLAALIGGVVFAWLGKSPWPYWIVGILLLYFVLINTNLLPVWLIPKPLRSTTVSDFGAKQGTLVGAAAIGVGVSLMMGPCAAPILTTILYIVAAKQDVFFGVTLLLAFSLGISGFMVGVSLLGRKAFTVLGKISAIRGYVGRVVDVLVLIIAAVLLYVGTEKAIAAWGPKPTTTQTATTQTDSNRPSSTTKARFYYFAGADESKALGKGGLKKGVRLPEFKLRTEDGKTLTVSAYHKNRWLFITFWGIWCKECVEEIPLVKKMASDNAVKDHLAILAVNVMDDPQKAKQFAKERGINYPVLSDEDAELAEEFLGVFSYPYNVLISPEGKIVYASGEFPKEYRKFVLANTDSK